MIGSSVGARLTRAFQRLRSAAYLASASPGARILKSGNRVPVACFQPEHPSSVSVHRPPAARQRRVPRIAAATARTRSRMLATPPAEVRRPQAGAGSGGAPRSARQGWRRYALRARHPINGPARRRRRADRQAAPRPRLPPRPRATGPRAGRGRRRRRRRRVGDSGRFSGRRRAGR